MMCERYTQHGFKHRIKYVVFLRKMRELGFNVDKKGICAGYAASWSQYCLNDKEILFLNAIESVCRKSSEVIAVLPQFNEIKAVLSSISQYQNPEEFKQCEVEKISQHFENLLPMVEVHSNHQLYSLAEIKTYFFELERLMQNAPMVMRISDHEHAIALKYDLKKAAWNLCDSERFFADQSPHLYVASQQIAEMIFANVFQIRTDELIALKIQFFTTLNHVELVKQVVDKFKDSVPLQKDRVLRLSSDGISLAYLAVKNYDAKTLASIAELKGDIVSQNPVTGNSPAHIAVILGHLPCARILLEYKADFLTLKNKQNLTPIEIAIAKSRWDILACVLLATKNFKTIDEKSAHLLMSPSLSEKLSMAFVEIFKGSNVELLLIDIAKRENALGIILNKPSSQLGKFKFAMNFHKYHGFSVTSRLNRLLQAFPGGEQSKKSIKS